MMAPLTALSGQAKDLIVKAFDNVKKLIAEQVNPVFPDPNIPFDIHTDASNCQLGAVIEQKRANLLSSSPGSSRWHNLSVQPLTTKCFALSKC